MQTLCLWQTFCFHEPWTASSLPFKPHQLSKAMFFSFLCASHNFTLVLREASQILWWGFFHNADVCQHLTCVLRARQSGENPFISYSLKLYLPKIRKHPNIATKHERGDILTLPNQFCLGQWCVMSFTPDGVSHGEKRWEETIPQILTERV